MFSTHINLATATERLSATEGARFEIHFEKARGIHGESVRPFEVKLEILNDKAIWTTREIDDVNLARVKALLEDELSVREVADETGIPKSTVQRLKKKIEADAVAAEVTAAAKDTPWDTNLDAVPRFAPPSQKMAVSVPPPKENTPVGHLEPLRKSQNLGLSQCPTV